MDNKKVSVIVQTQMTHQLKATETTRKDISMEFGVQNVKCFIRKILSMKKDISTCKAKISKTLLMRLTINQK